MKVVFLDENECFMAVDYCGAIVVSEESNWVAFSLQGKKVGIPVEDALYAQDTILDAIEGSRVIDLRDIQDGPAQFFQ